MRLQLNEENIVWPGGLTQKPTGLMIPTHLKVLTILEKPFVYARPIERTQVKNLANVNSRLSMCSIARESNASFYQVSPIKVEVCKSFIFTESSLVFENKDHLVDFYCHTLF